MPARTASARWEGGLRGGSGTMRLGSGAYEGAYSFWSRFEDGTGTNPEELLGAAHAGCFSMALSAGLERAGHPPTSVETDRPGPPRARRRRLPHRAHRARLHGGGARHRRRRLPAGGGGGQGRLPGVQGPRSGRHHAVRHSGQLTGSPGGPRRRASWNRPGGQPPRAARALRTRCALTGRAVPSAWAKKLTRSSSSSQRTSTTSASPGAPGGARRPPRAYWPLDRTGGRHQLAVAGRAGRPACRGGRRRLRGSARGRAGGRRPVAVTKPGPDQRAQLGRACPRPPAAAPGAACRRGGVSRVTAGGHEARRPGPRRRPPGRQRGPGRRAASRAKPSSSQPGPPCWRRSGRPRRPRSRRPGRPRRDVAGAAARAGTAREPPLGLAPAPPAAPAAAAVGSPAPWPGPGRPPRPDPHRHRVALVDAAPGSPARGGRRPRRRRSGAASPTSHVVEPAALDAGAASATARRTRPPRRRRSSARSWPLATSAPVAVLDAEAHRAGGRAPWSRSKSPGATRSPASVASRRASDVEQRPVARGRCAASASRAAVGRGHQVAPHRLRAASGPGRSPGRARCPGTCQSKPSARDLVEHGERHVDGHAVVGGARPERVGDGERQVALVPRRRGRRRGRRRRRRGRAGRRG